MPACAFGAFARLHGPEAEVDITIRVLMKAGAYNDALRSSPKKSLIVRQLHLKSLKLRHPTARTNARNCMGVRALRL